MLKRMLASAFGTFLFAIAAPLLYVLLVGVPQSFVALAAIVAVGVVIGMILGALFPRAFGFVFDAFLESLSDS